MATADTYVKCLICGLWVALAWNGMKLTVQPHDCGKRPRINNR